MYSRKDRLNQYCQLDEKIQNKISFRGFQKVLDNPKLDWNKITTQNQEWDLYRDETYERDMIDMLTNKQYIKYRNYSQVTDYVNSWDNEDSDDEFVEFLESDSDCSFEDEDEDYY